MTSLASGKMGTEEPPQGQRGERTVVIKPKRLQAEGATRQASSVAWGIAVPGKSVAKAKERAPQASRTALRPQLARTELLEKSARMRFEQEVDAALKRRPSNEARLAGALRAVASLSPALRAAMGEATSVLIRRGTRQRELYASGLRALAEAQDRQAATLLRQALSGDDAGGPAALSASCFSREADLAPLLAKIAASRQSHLAFGAELARVARYESNGALLAQLAPMIKESHRIAMCVELFVPLTRANPVAVDVGPALSVLRGAERHLGRWLVLAEVAVMAGDTSPIDDARARIASGPSSSRAAWSLVAWALLVIDAVRRGAPLPEAPTARPTLELIARLSDRPSADRDTTFLFRMARRHVVSARPMLDGFARTLPLCDETSMRSAVYLALDHGRDDLREALADAAETGKREELRGLAAAALWDACSPGVGECSAKMRLRASNIAHDLIASRTVGNVAWGALILAAAKASGPAGPLVTETAFRWIQLGWLE
ncbi:MAG: hypothetical protein M3O50_00425 [Myxococcota bacterium]|nr:hypothetical protein [Myxococcota bacterium]